MDQQIERDQVASALKQLTDCVERSFEGEAAWRTCEELRLLVERGRAALRLAESETKGLCPLAGVNTGGAFYCSRPEGHTGPCEAVPVHPKPDAYEHAQTIAAIDELAARLQGPGGRASSRERSLAVTKLQEAAMWLIEDARQEDLRRQEVRESIQRLRESPAQELRESIQRRPERDVRAVTCGEVRGTLCCRTAGHVGQCSDVDDWRSD